MERFRYSPDDTPPSLPRVVSWILSPDADTDDDTSLPNGASWILSPDEIVNLSDTSGVTFASDSDENDFESITRGEELLRQLNLKKIKIDLRYAIQECLSRGLLQTSKWLSELNHSLQNVKLEPTDLVLPLPSLVEDQEIDQYILAKNYFDLREYDRCAHFTDWCQSPKARFLHLYSRYLSVEKKKLDNTRDSSNPFDPAHNANLLDLLSELKRDYMNESLDGYGLYLYGVVLIHLDLTREAQVALLESVFKEPLLWASWLELAALVIDKAQLNKLALPDHWMKQFFLGHIYLDQQFNDEALDIYWDLQQVGFENSHYILAQTAIAYHNRRDVDLAIETFRRLQKIDPYRLDNLDTYSNLLYVKEMKVELAHLAHEACEIDKYRVETCCVIGNYYSLRSEHQKAVLYFQRALKLNPRYLSAWTLMGHEFMEMKNTNAAIQSYRQAIEVNSRDYRAWYGLGQTYEILKMMFYSLYYYKKAQQLRPSDSRMLIALGETYEKMDKVRNALCCFSRARNVGDIEGTALFKMARLFDKLNETESAATAYLAYIKESENRQIGDKNEICQAYKFLAHYYMKRNELDSAYSFAQKCLEYEETKEEGKNLLKLIAQKRSLVAEIIDLTMDESPPNAPVRPRPRLAEGSHSVHITPMTLSFS